MRAANEHTDWALVARVANEDDVSDIVFLHCDSGELLLVRWSESQMRASADEAELMLEQGPFNRIIVVGTNEACPGHGHESRLQVVNEAAFRELARELKLPVQIKP